jgi:Holliday junction resolvase RusA-like endonuclease
MRICFTIPGKPFGKQRHRIGLIHGKARAFNTKGNEAFDAGVGYIAARHFPAPITGPVAVTITAQFCPPPSWSKRKRAEAMGRPHTSKPDTDNVGKAILDGLNRIAFADDAQVAQITIRKVWGASDCTAVVVEGLDLRADAVPLLGVIS